MGSRLILVFLGLLTLATGVPLIHSRAKLSALAEISATQEPTNGTATNGTATNATASKEAEEPSSAAGPICDVIAPNGICLFDGQKVLVPDASPAGLVGRYTFDKARFLDSSRYQNHDGTSVVPNVQGRYGMGGAGEFDGTIWVKIPDAPSLRFDKGYTVSFWVFGFPPTKPVGGPNMKFCTIIGKGEKNPPDAKEPLKPNALNWLFEIALEAPTRRLRISAERVGLTTPLMSEGQIREHQWTHVAVTLGANKKLSLYLNGILDVEAPVTAVEAGVNDKNPIYVGNAPFQPPCELRFFMDELRLTNQGMSSLEIQAESGPTSMGAFPTSFVRFGCRNCALGAAKDVCSKITGFGLCSAKQLRTSVYQMSRTMGWSSYNTMLWDAEDESETKARANPALKGMGICCKLDL